MYTKHYTPYSKYNSVQYTVYSIQYTHYTGCNDRDDMREGRKTDYKKWRPAPFVQAFAPLYFTALHSAPGMEEN